MDTRTAQLTEAREKSATARSLITSAPTAKARREAAEDHEFWSSRVSFLEGWLATEAAA